MCVSRKYYNSTWFVDELYSHLCVGWDGLVYGWPTIQEVSATLQLNYCAANQ